MANINEELNKTEKQLKAIENSFNLDNAINKLKEISSLFKSINQSFTSDINIDNTDFKTVKKEINSLTRDIENLKNIESDDFIGANTDQFQRDLNNIAKKYDELIAKAMLFKKEAAINIKGEFYNEIDKQTGDIIDSGIDSIDTYYTALNTYSTRFSEYINRIEDEKGNAIYSIKDEFKYIEDYFPQLSEIMKNTMKQFNSLVGLKGVFTKSNAESLIPVEEQVFSGIDKEGIVSYYNSLIGDINNELKGESIQFPSITVDNLSSEKEIESTINSINDSFNKLDNINSTDLYLLQTVSEYESKIQNIISLLSDITSFNGFNKMANQAVSAVAQIEKFSGAFDVIDYSRQFNIGREEFKNLINDELKAPEIQNIATKIINPQSEEELINKIVELRDKINKKVAETNNKYNNENILNDISDDAINARYEKRINDLNKINELKEKASNISITQGEYDEDLVSADIDYYNKDVEKAITNAYNLREEIARIQNSINTGNTNFDTQKILGSLGSLSELASKSERQSLTDEKDIQNAELLEQIVNAIVNDIKNIDNTVFIDSKNIDELRKLESVLGTFNFREEFLTNNKFEVQSLTNKIRQAEFEYAKLNELIERTPNTLKSSTSYINLDDALNYIRDEIQLYNGRLNKIKEKFNKLGIPEPNINMSPINTDSFEILKNATSFDKKGKEFKLFPTIDANYLAFSKRVITESNAIITQIDKTIEREGILSGRDLGLKEKYAIYEEQLKKISKTSEEYIVIRKRMIDLEKKINAEEIKNEANNILDYTKKYKRETGNQLPIIDQYNYLTKELESFSLKYGKESPEYDKLLDAVRDLEDKLKQAEIDAKNAEEKEKLTAVNEQIKTRKQEADKILNHIADTEAATGQKMPVVDKLNYMQTAMHNFVSAFGYDSEEYKKILKSLRSVEEEYNKEQTNIIAEQEKLAQEQAQIYNNYRAERANDILKSVKTQEISTGIKMPLVDQLEYYKQALNDFISEFGEDADEIIAIQERIQRTEEQIANEAHRVRQQELEDAFRADDERKRLEQEALKEQEDAKNTIKNILGQVLSTVQSALYKLVDIVKRSIDMVKRTVQLGIRFIQNVSRAIERLLRTIANFGNRLRNQNKNVNVLKGSFTELRSKILLLTGAYNKLFNNQFVQNGKKLLQSIQTLNIVMGSDLTNNTIRWANTLEGAFGLSASQIISDIQGISAVLYGIGMNSQDTEFASRNIAAIGNSLAAITGYDPTTVFTKLESGIKGMTQSVDDLGISVRESQMNQFLKDIKAQGGEFKNISDSFVSLNERQRTYVRTAAIIKQFTDRFTADQYINSLDSITGRLSILSARIQSLKTVIGTFALQVLDRITIPIATALTILEAKIKAFAANFDIDLNLSSKLNKNNDALGNTSSNLDDINSELTDLNKNANNALDSFDHISTISSSNAGDNFDYSKLLTAIPDYASELEEKAKEAQNKWLDEQIELLKAKIKEALDDIKNSISKWWYDLTGRVIDWDKLVNNLKSALNSLKQILNSIIGIAKSLFDIIAGIFGMFAQDIKLTRLLADISELFASISSFVKTFLETLKPILFDWYNSYLKPKVEWIGIWLHNHIKKWTGYFKELTSWAKSDDGKNSISAWFNNLSQFIDKVIAKLKGFKLLIATFLFGKDNAFANEYTGINSDHIKKSKESKKEDYYNSGLDPKLLDIGDSFSQILRSLWDIVKQIGIDIKEWFNTEGIELIRRHFERIANILSENKDGIVKIIEGVANAFNKIKESILTKIEDIFEWIAQHPDLINGMLQLISNTISLLIDHIGTIIALIGALKLVGKIILVITTLGKLKDAIDILIGTSAAGGVAGLAAKIATAAGGIKSFVTVTIPSLFSSIAGLFTSIGSKVVGFFSTATSSISGFFSTCISKVVSLASTISSKLLSLGPSLATALPFLTSAAVGTAGVKANWNIFSGLGLFGDQILGRDTGGYTLDNIEEKAAQHIEALKKKFESLGETKIPMQAIEEYSNNFKKYLTESTDIGDKQIEHIVSKYTAELEAGTRSGFLNLKQISHMTDEEYNKLISKSAETSKNIDNTINESTESTLNSLSSMFNEQGNLITNTQNTTVQSLDVIFDEQGKLINRNTDLKDSFYGVGLEAQHVAVQTSKRFNDNKNNAVRFRGELSLVNGQLKQMKNNLNDLSEFSININKTTNSQTGIDRIKSFFGHANGGVPSKGSLFMANENGMPELVGNFGGYTGVANQSMILKAMNDSISSSVYNAVVAALNNTEAQGNNIEICKNGMFVGDDNAIRKLANIFNNALVSSRGNIANTGFSTN